MKNSSGRYLILYDTVTESKPGMPG